MDDVVLEGHSPIDKALTSCDRELVPSNQTSSNSCRGAVNKKDSQAPSTSNVVDTADSDSSHFESASSENEIEDTSDQCRDHETTEKLWTDKTDDGNNASTYFKHSSKRKTDFPRLISDGDEEVIESENCEKEIEEDDLTSKLLLSIQVLPRIPKRKLQVDEGDGFPSAEKQSYRSVLERVETAANRGMGSYSNWSTSGWKRASDDKVSDDRGTWNRKNDKKGKGKWSDRSKAIHSVELRSNANETLNNNDRIKTSRPSSELVSASSMEHNSQSVGFLDDEFKVSVERAGHAVPACGPLPTLPFDEQMRERAKLRSLQNAIRTDSSGTAITSDETPGSCYDTGNSTDVHSSIEQPVAKTLNNSSSHVNGENNAINVTKKHKPGSRNNKTDRQLHTSDSTENMADNHQLVMKKSHRTNQSLKSNQPALVEKVADRHKTHGGRSVDIGQHPGQSTSELLSKSSAKHSPPLPHLPVLPLFASVCSTDDIKSGISDTSKLPVSSSAEVNEGTSRDDSKKRGSISAKVIAAGSKTVTFSCPEGVQKLSGRKGKHKKTQDKKHRKTEDKLSKQDQVVKEMKNYLKPYYMRRQITKEEYKDIMRRAVPRICHERQHEEIRASRIHKYASAYVDKVLMQRSGQGVELADNLSSVNKHANIPPPPPYS